MKLNKFMTLAKQHLPEILTATSVLGVITSDALFVYAAKQEMMDGDKKHYILPIIVSGVTVGCIIASNRVSNTQKASLAAGLTLMADNYYKQRQAIKEVCTPEQQAEIDELLMMAQDAYTDDTAFSESKELFYFPQLNLIWWGTQGDLSYALNEINSDFVTNWFATLNRFLLYLGIDDKDHQLASKDLIWRIHEYDYDCGIKTIKTSSREKTLKNGRICHYIEFDYPPMTDEQWREEYDEAEYDKDEQQNFPIKTYDNDYYNEFKENL